ncbi:MAG TPA: PVC-type heme-binding CxxCH protein [Pirellulales bacterium]|nr:PVC-type heme-binding CxxCH protein [Pirellulales bacterium]
MQSHQMKMLALVSAWFVLAVQAGLVTTVTAAEVAAGRYTFRVPDGFTVQAVADEPLVKYPICADFDERGRLYVCESSGTAEWNKPQPKETLHRVVRLEDSDGDGRFDRRTTFAEFEMMAQGSAWLGGSLYVAAAPVIWKLTDADDDGVAETRQAWVTTKEVTACLNDLRGPYVGPDGYIYWCKGPATQTYSLAGGPWTTSARHVLRRHPDATDVDNLLVGGMDNPVEVAFAADGERFVTCTNFQMLGEPRDDGILHAVYGAVHPKDIAPVFEFPWTGPDLMPKLTGWGAMSPAGLACYQSTVLGDEFQGNLFSALFSGHKVLRHVLEERGGTFAARDEEFLGCDNVEFHPTDVLEDADGSLLVIDTGGWYLHCCPSSTFYRPGAHGAIYRISRMDAAAPADPRGASLDWPSLSHSRLAELLGDGRPAVRRRAIESLASKGEDACAVLRSTLSSGSPTARCSAIWAATRMDRAEGRAVVRQGLDDRDETVRRAALNSVSLHRDRGASAQLLQILASGAPRDCRLAAEALGRLRDPAATPALLARLALPADRFVEHALIYALIEIADPESTRGGMKSPHPSVRRAAMIALDQIPGGELDPRAVIAELDAPDERTRDVVWWLISRHPQALGGLLVERLQNALADETKSDDARAQLRRRLARLARVPTISDWIVRELTSAGLAAEARMLLLEAMGDAGGEFADPRWVESLSGLLQENGDATLIGSLLVTLGKLPPLAMRDEAARKVHQSLNSRLFALADQADLPAEARVRALAAVRDKSLGGLSDTLLSFLIRSLAPEQPLSLRTSAAEVLARSQLTGPQLVQLSGALKNLGTAELNAVLSLFQGKTDEEIGRRLVSSLLASRSATGLNAFRLRSVLAGFPEHVQQQAQPLLDRLEQAQAEQLARANRVLALVDQADPNRGLNVFQSQKAACTACHKAAHVGGTLGPHLQGIGKRRAPRDLVESILFPSASLVQSYEPWIVITGDGRTLTGVLVEDKPDEIVLSAGTDKMYRLPRSAIEEMTRGQQSIMPDGLDKTLADQDLADLIAYLKSL